MSGSSRSRSSGTTHSRGLRLVRLPHCLPGRSWTTLAAGRAVRSGWQGGRRSERCGSHVGHTAGWHTLSCRQRHVVLVPAAVIDVCITIHHVKLNHHHIRLMQIVKRNHTCKIRDDTTCSVCTLVQLMHGSIIWQL